ncbi:MAG: 4Fe-4S dicluster domain-containing protein, partial [Candidatus Binataceae bacterium]
LRSSYEPAHPTQNRTSRSCGPFWPIFRNFGPGGRLTPIKDFETAEIFGVSRVEQYTWKQLLDRAACLECGRCTINCPTVQTGKTLNPKFLVIEQREHLLDKMPSLLAQRFGSDTSEYNGPDMITEVATEAAVWGCTNCKWCEEGCPVGIEHIQRIDDMRRHLVLMESRFPPEATAAFRGIEVQGNPWGLAQEKRPDWAKPLGVPLIGQNGPQDLEVLFWVGCAGS